MTATGDVYFSVDIEADGPIPGPYSMLSMGIAVAGRFDGDRFTPCDLTAETFYAELAPISDEFDEDALAVAHLDRERLVREGEDPVAAMKRAARWVEDTAGEAVGVRGVAGPFDWMFTHWYFVRFVGRDPFGYASYLDVKSMYVARSRRTLADASPDGLPPELRSARPHTHHALDDAIRQGEVFARLFDWHPPA